MLSKCSYFGSGNNHFFLKSLSVVLGMIRVFIQATEFNCGDLGGSVNFHDLVDRCSCLFPVMSDATYYEGKSLIY